MKKLLVLLFTILLIACSKEEVVIEKAIIPSGHTFSETALFLNYGEEEEAMLDEGFHCRSISSYNYSSPIPYSGEVSTDYFQNTFFGGDSRVGSIALYTNLLDFGADVQYITSLSLWRVYDMNVSEAVPYSLMELIQMTGRKNIYLLIGVNEMNGSDVSVWRDEYDAFVKEIQSAHPDANVILMTCYTPQDLHNLPKETIRAYVDAQNGAIKEIALNNHALYLDLNEALDVDGYVSEDFVWDGVHLNIDGAKVLEDYIRTHVYQEESYVKKVCE